VTQYRWRTTCGAHGHWQGTTTGIDAGMIGHVRHCTKTEECDDAGYEVRT